MKKFIIKSISDLITNSSSEVFCIISHPDKEILDQIHTDLYEIFDGWRAELEQDVYVHSFDTEKDSKVEIEMPYNKNEYIDFYQGGIERFLEENYKDFELKWI